MPVRSEVEFRSKKFYAKPETYLVGSAYEIQIVLLQKCFNYVLAKHEGDASLVLAPAACVLIRVGPEKVAEQATIWDIRWPLNLSDLI